MGKHIGFVSFRIAGTDGVSLETKKWEDVLTAQGHHCYFFGGELDTPDESSYLVEEAHFNHPKMKELYLGCFENPFRPRSLTKELHKYREFFKEKLYDFIEKYQIDVLIPENSLTIPLNIPLAMAMTEVLIETGIDTVAHHHDFFWERKRFLRNCIWEIINSCYPPHLSNIQHVVINSSAQNQLALRTGISSVLIPNVMQFEVPPTPMDEYSADVRKALGISKSELLVLQPTRVVQRKGIEHAIEFVARLEQKATLVISHASGDEGYEYQERVKEYAKLLGIKALFISEIIGETRGKTKDGKKIYMLQDIYPHADLITYPSIFEGFGNAFLEAIYFKKPILVNNYSIYSHDIKPKGFDVIEMDNFISRETIHKAKSLLKNPVRIEEMVAKNYALGLKYYSYHILDAKLKIISTNFWGKRNNKNGIK